MVEACGVEVRLPEGDDTNGLGQIMAQYIEQNYADFPKYAKRTRRIKRVVTIDANDVDVQTTMAFDNGIVTVTSGAVEKPDMSMSGDWLAMTDIAAGKRYGLGEWLLGRVRISPMPQSIFGAHQLFAILKVPRAYLEQRGIEMPPWRVLHPLAFKVSIGLGVGVAVAGIAAGLEQC